MVKSKGSCTTSFPSETAKIRPKVLKYFPDGSKVLDYGCGTDKIVPHAIGIDMRQVPGVDIPIFKLNDVYDLEVTTFQKEVGTFDAIYSSHFLEHLKDDARMLNSWIKLLRVGGFLTLYLPSDLHYDNASNPEHFQIYTHDGFVSRIKREFAETLKVLEHGLDVGPDRYSFYLVAEKL